MTYRTILTAAFLGLFFVFAVSVAQAQDRLADISYGTGALQKFDLYSPPAPKAAPLIIMVHGGAWRFGDKANSGVVKNKAAYWTQKGYIFASVNYPMMPKATPYAQAQSVAKAVAFIQKNATNYGIDPRRIILMGHSAGAHLVTLVSADKALQKQAGVAPWAGTVSLDTGALDIPKIMTGKPQRFYVKAFGSDPKLWRKTSPMLVLRQRTEPVLLVCSRQRRGVCKTVKTYADKAKSYGSRARVLPVDLSHKQINETLGTATQYTRLVDKWITAALH